MFHKIKKYAGANHKSFYLGLAALTLIGLYYSWLILVSGDFFALHSQNASDRQALLEIREKIKIGNSYEQVLQDYWSNSHHTRLNISTGSPDGWAISMHPEVFSNDWRMYINFRNGKVIGYRIRTSDGPHPGDVPEDIGENDD